MILLDFFSIAEWFSIRRLRDQQQAYPIHIHAKWLQLGIPWRRAWNVPDVEGSFNIMRLTRVMCWSILVIWCWCNSLVSAGTGSSYPSSQWANQARYYRFVSLFFWHLFGWLKTLNLECDSILFKDAGHLGNSDQVCHMVKFQLEN